MPAEELRQQLHQLHEMLSEIEIPDEATSASLRQVADEIARLLRESAADSVTGPSTVGEDLKGLMLKFETEHPRLTEMLSRITQTLANLGI